MLALQVPQLSSYLLTSFNILDKHLEPLSWFYNPHSYINLRAQISISHFGLYIGISSLNLTLFVSDPHPLTYIDATLVVLLLHRLTPFYSKQGSLCPPLPLQFSTHPSLGGYNFCVAVVSMTDNHMVSRVLANV